MFKTIFQASGQIENILVPSSVKLLEPRGTNPEITTQDLYVETKKEKLKGEG